MMKQVEIILGASYGDEGKGKVTSYFANEYKNQNSIVIRFNGGSQAAHRTVNENIEHISSNFGSGVLFETPTYWSHYCPLDPVGLMNESYCIFEKYIKPIHYVHPLTPIITPYDIMATRLNPNSKIHGSCGIGIGSTMKRNEQSPYKIFAKDIFNEWVLKHKLNAVKDYYIKQGGAVAPSSDVMGRFMLACQDFLTFTCIKPYKFLNQFNVLLFEGAQGILLDAEHGFFPHVTYSNSTSRNALEILSKLNDIGNINVNYVSRCYQTRHGNGPLEGENSAVIKQHFDLSNEKNVTQEFQGDFRLAPLSLNILKYAIDTDASCIDLYDDFYYNGRPINKSLFITCLDQNTSGVIPYLYFDKIKEFKISEFEDWARWNCNSWLNIESVLFSYSDTSSLKIN